MATATAVNELLANPAFQLPKERTQAQTFREALESACRAYSDAVRSMSAQDAATDSVRARHQSIVNLSAGLLETVDAALAGKDDQALRIFDDAMAPIAAEVEAYTSKPLTRDVIGTLFRLRKGVADAAFRRKDLFHNPRSETNPPGAQRYSPVGTPMLYLGGSLNICWLEYNKPETDVWSAAYRVRSGRELRVWDLGYRPDTAAWLAAASARAVPKTADTLTTFVAAYGVIWPLLAACSFRTVDGSTKPYHEYLIPQLLMGWIQKADTIHGIRYFSSKLVGTNVAIAASANFVFPARQLDRAGHCSLLQELFELTEPVYWADLGKGVSQMKARAQLLPRELIPAAETPFGPMESLLIASSFAQLNAASTASECFSGVLRNAISAILPRRRR